MVIEGQYLTEKEVVILNAIISGSECKNISNYLECLEDGDSDTWVNIESICYHSNMNEYEAGGILASLDKKYMVQLLDKREYSLGCNCWVIYKSVVKEMIGVCV